MANTHTDLVDRQFGAQAQAYVTSAVHAAGADLQQITDLLRGQTGAHVLDLGCGGGHVSYAVAPLVQQVTACDLSDRMLDAVRRTAAERGLSNIVTQQGLAGSLPFPDARFDYVISRYSAHHWPDLEAGLREAARVLKRGGHAIFADVIAPATTVQDTFLQTIEMLRDPSHVRDYSAAQWHAALRQAGFDPGHATARRLHLEFGSWVARIGTPDTHIAAIRSLQNDAPDSTKDYFEIQPDGSFSADILLIEATRAADR